MNEITALPAIEELSIALALCMRRLQSLEARLGVDEIDLTGVLAAGLTYADER